MENCVLHQAALAELGLDLAGYDRLVGDIYDGALDPKPMARTLANLREAFHANYVTLILRVP
ncbi:MAG: LuxR family transcriptional regulator, partial [Pseudomonas sp.]|nr:LuxR family transcriptional regulator [Pseudomonas sp.]